MRHGRAPGETLCTAGSLRQTPAQLGPGPLLPAWCGPALLGIALLSVSCAATLPPPLEYSDRAAEAASTPAPSESQAQPSSEFEASDIPREGDAAWNAATPAPPEAWRSSPPNDSSAPAAPGSAAPGVSRSGASAVQRSPALAAAGGMPSDGQNDEPQAGETAPSFGEGAVLDSGSSAPRASTSLQSSSPPAAAAAEAARGETAQGETTEALAPSFGDGAELLRRDPGASGAEAYLGRETTGMPPAIPGAVRIAPPVPPPVPTEAHARLVYQCQNEVYGLQLAVIGRPIGPGMLLRIEVLRQHTLELQTLSRGRPRQLLLAQQVQRELDRLDTAARARDRSTVQHSLVILQDLLAKMRSLP